MQGIRKATIAIIGLLTAIVLSACSGGGGGIGIGTGTGGDSGGTLTAAGTTSGTIIGFGSVIVDGVEFNRKTGLANDKIRLPFDNLTSAGEDKLRPGMNVTVKWERDASGKQVYTAIEFQPALRGPADDVSVANNSVTVMGKTVQIEAGTVFDSVRDLAEISTDLGNLKHPEIEISGFDDGTVIHATRIAKKSADFATGTKLAQVRGAIVATPVPTASSFKVGGVTVNVTASTVFANFANSPPTAADFAASTLVEVKGTLAAGVLTAARVEKKTALGEAKAEDSLQVKGIIVGTPDATNKIFNLNSPIGTVGVTTDANTVFFKGATSTGVAFADIVTAGATLEVEGTLKANGTILATKVKVELEKVLKLEGNVAAAADVSTSSNTIKLNGVTVTVTSLTMFTDPLLTTFALKDIIVNDHLQISGFIDASGKVVASLVQRTANSTAIFIQGPVTAVAKPNLTVLGIPVPTDALNTTFKKLDKTVFAAPAQDNFFAAVTANQTVVKVKFKANQAFADEVEIEQKL